MAEHNVGVTQSILVATPIYGGIQVRQGNSKHAVIASPIDPRQLHHLRTRDGWRAPTNQGGYKT